MSGNFNSWVGGEGENVTLKLYSLEKLYRKLKADFRDLKIAGLF